MYSSSSTIKHSLNVMFALQIFNFDELFYAFMNLYSKMPGIYFGNLWFFLIKYGSFIYDLQ